MGMVVNPYAFGFTPLQIADITAWFHSLEDSSFTLSGANVTGWKNLAGSQTVAAAVNTPTRQTVNSRQMLSFNGTNQLCVADNHADFNFGSGDFSIWTVSRADDVNRGTIVSKFSGTPGYMMRYNDADTNNGDLYGFMRDASSNSAIPIHTAVNYNDNVVRILGLVRDGNTARLYSGNTQVQTADASAVGSVDNTGAALNIGSIAGAYSGGAGASTFLNGEVGEIIMVKRVLSADERADLIAWLTDRWGL